MAQKVVVSLVDDLDGTTGDTSEITTVHFGLDGVDYEIDLTGDNQEALREILTDYIEHGRRTGGRMRRPVVPAKEPARSKEETQAMRQWARRNGFETIADRGRIPQQVVDAYDAAHAPERPGRKPGRTGKK